MTRFYRHPPKLEPDGDRDLVKAEAWGTDRKPYEAWVHVRVGLLNRDPRHLETIYALLEKELRDRMQAKGIW